MGKIWTLHARYVPLCTFGLKPAVSGSGPCIACYTGGMDLNESRIAAAAEFADTATAFRAAERKAAPPGDRAREKRIRSFIKKLNGHSSRLRSIRGAHSWNTALLTPEDFDRMVDTSKRLQYERTQLKKMLRSDPAG